LSHNLTHEFEKGLKQLDMLVPDLPETSGLVFVDEFPSNEYEYIALEKAKKYDVDAVYFRRFDSGRASIPQIYIYDFTDRKENEGDIAELHKRLWNAGQVPLFFIFTRTEVKIFNCLKSPDVLDIETRKIVSTPMEIIELAAGVEKELDKQKEFSAKKFDNGSFWETSRYKNNFNLSDGSYETLLTYLKIIRDKAIKEKILEKPIIQKLLVMTILVKYLEERQDSEGNTVFPENFFSRFAKDAKCFTDVLKEKGACLKLFDNLSQHFNGEIFKWDDKAERDKLSQTDLKSFASLFLEARTDVTGQRTLWPLYSFNDLPIELISNIYEEFLGNKKGIVYTPPYLVRFLIDEAMPLVEFKENFKVLDPACGSGVFLVAAYQRIIDWWRIRNDWRKPGLNTLKKLLRSNIYGVDIDPEAVRLTIFSLSLALFDELSPKEIWENLKFDDLKSSGNLHEKDFFELILHQKLEDDFDLVIGNPPFIEKFTTLPAKQIEKKQQKKRVQIPGNQLSLLFLEQSMTVCKSGGLLCLISPSGPFLYNNNSFEFRKYFLKTYNVKQIVDFTALSEVLFGRANVAILSVFVKKEKSDSKKILHVTVRRTKPSKEKIYFELDHYDFHHISYKDALNNKLLWKSNFLGGGRLHHLVSRLSSLRKFIDYLNEKKEYERWVIGEGFILSDKKDVEELENLQRQIRGLSQNQLKEYERLKRRCKKADFLTGKKTLPIKSFSEKGIDESKIHILKENYFYRKAEKNKLIFHGPHVLIKEGVGKQSIPISFRKDSLSFKNSIIGIHAPENQVNELQKIEKRIKNNQTYLFWLAAYSGRYMINKASSLLKGDIENLPYPEDEKELELSDIEKVLVDDVLEYMLDFRRKGENSKAVRTVNGKQLENFGETYCKILNTVYKEFKPHEPIITDSFVCFPVYYGEQPKFVNEDLDKFENYLGRLVYKEIGRNLRIVRVLRVYDNNIVYLVKPNQVRYWLRSVAIRDADETFADLVKQGY
jgi:hypothetical protein